MTEPGELTRLEKLEALATHQERVIEELSGELATQWKTIERMQSKLNTLTERFLVLEEQSLQAPAITKPPHY